jgi:pSer/pThr/pTyr-binding forkhead associated (FHA) protein
MRSWVIGSNADCDVVSDSPLVSSRHCRLAQTQDGYVLTDLGSTNGTYVNGQRITAPTRIAAGDSVTLSLTVPFPWPPELVTYVSIGRLDDNNIVLDDSRVSGHHARLIIVVGLHTLIEDLGSSNGTFLNSTANRVTGPARISEPDTLYFGALPVPAARLLAGRNAPGTAARTRSGTTIIRQPLPEPAAATVPAAPPGAGNPWLPVWLLAQAPVFAVLIVAMSGRPPAAPITEATRGPAGQTIASVTFALALAAVFLGGSLAAAEWTAGRPPRRPAGVEPAAFFSSLGQRLGLLAALCAVGCALMLTIVYQGSDLAGPWLAMCALVLAASLVGLFLGFLVPALVRNRATAAGVLAACVVLMIVLGGRVWPLPRMFPPVRQLAQFMPTRWAFEGLFLLEAAGRGAPSAAGGGGAPAKQDLAEEFFPAASERMGTRADAMALASMLIGLAAPALVIWGLSRPGP